MFRILRYFSLTSLVIFLLAAAMLVTLYRQVAIRSIVKLGEASNVAVAQTALNSVHAQLVDYLTSVSSPEGARIRQKPLGARLELAVQNLIRDTSVDRIKIHSRHGIVVFSSLLDQVGSDESGNPGFTTAIHGKIASRLLYHDSFNPFDKTTDEDNFIQTYLPVRSTPTGPVLGVFEIYTDVNGMVKSAEHTSLVLMAGATLILALLYAAMLVIVQRVARIIERQQDTIHERTRALELVSAGLLTAQENERKRVAEGLHEGLAQTLSAIKMNLEAAALRLGKERSSTRQELLEPVLRGLQQAIQEVRVLAMELRPPSLDDLGLLDTLAWYFRKFRTSHTGIRIDAELLIEEARVPEHLKSIIYRLTQEIFEYMVRQRHATGVRVQLDSKDDHITLVLGDSGQPYRAEVQVAPTDSITIASARERVVLSGGTFSIEETPWGATLYRASWPTTTHRASARA